MADAATVETESAGTIESLSAVFNEPEGKADDPQKADAAKPDGEKGEAEGEKKDGAEGEGKKAESPSAETATAKERALQAEIDRIRAKNRKLEEGAKTPEPVKVPDPIEDPEGYASHLQAESGRNEFKTKIALSRDLMLDTREDFIEKEKVFMGLVADEDGNIIDETLFRKFQNAPNPARFAYNHAKEYIEVQELKSPQYREKLRAEIRAELEAEFKGKKPKSAVEVPDLTKATAAASNSSPVEELTELKDMFRDSKL